MNAEPLLSMVSRAEGDISLIEYFRGLFARWRLVLAIVVTAAVLSVALALLLPQKFTAQVVIVEKTDRTNSTGSAAMLSRLGSLAQFAGIDLGTLGSEADNAGATLHSRYLLERFIATNNLLPLLFADEWDAQAKRWTTTGEDTPTLWRGVKLFSEEIYEIKEDLTRGTITLQVEWTDPVLAARWANDLAKLSNEIVRKRALADAQRNLAYLNQELAHTNVIGLQQVLYTMVQNEMQTIMLANDRDNYAFTVIDPAVVPELRSFPNRPLMAVAGTLLGGFIALLTVLVQMLIQVHREREAGPA